MTACLQNHGVPGGRHRHRLNPWSHVRNRSTDGGGDCSPPPRPAGSPAAVTTKKPIRSSRPRSFRLILSAALLAACAATFPPPAGPDMVNGVTARVEAVVDGDTLVVYTDTGRRRVRLFGIDAPEADQRHGGKSRDTLAALVLHKAVELQVVDSDLHGRLVALVSRDGVDINLVMVQSGWAWHSRRHNPRAELQQAEAAARLGRRGLWVESAPVPPWAWRRSH